MSQPAWIRNLFFWLREVALDPIGAMGIVLATLGGGLFVALVVLGMVGVPFNHYVGIFIYLGLPAVLLIGLLLIPIGRWRLARRHPEGKLPRFDFENPRHLRALGVFLGLTVVNVCLFGMASYGAYHVSESNEFCGTLCHTVMEPEWTRHQLSPHSRVKCVECHIGPGADWFVRSKLSGARQVLAVAMNTYTRPIETPVHNLRPARETCEQCHWPEKFHGDKLVTRTHYDTDEESTELTTALLLRIGGGTVDGRPTGGIHWHTNPAHSVTYVSTDDSRAEIPWVQLEDADGTVITYVSGDAEEVDELLATRDKRTMDCIDCHNRPTHVYETPENVVDRLIVTGLVPRDLPYLKRNAVRALRALEDGGEDPVRAIRAELDELYADVEGADPGALDALAAQLGPVWPRTSSQRCRSPGARTPASWVTRTTAAASAATTACMRRPTATSSRTIARRATCCWPRRRRIR